MGVQRQMDYGYGFTTSTVGYTSPSVDVDEVVITDKASVVQLSATVADRDFEATGAAVRQGKDKHDPDIAELVATADALESLARKVRRAANGAVKHADDMRAYKRKQAKDRELKAVERDLDRQERADERRGWREFRTMDAFEIREGDLIRQDSYRDNDWYLVNAAGYAGSEILFNLTGGSGQFDTDYSSYTSGQKYNKYRFDRFLKAPRTWIVRRKSVY